MTGCSGQSEDCPKTADFPTSSQSVSYTGSAPDSITTASFPMKGGHLIGRGSSGSSGPHFWPWSSGSHASQCDAHPETTQAP
jgi:hypothetical protein